MIRFCRLFTGLGLFLSCQFSVYAGVELAQPRITFVESWPGNGISIDFRLEDTDGGVVDADISDAITAITSSSSEAIANRVVKLPRSATHLSVVLLSSAENSEQRRITEAARNLVTRLSKEIQISVYLWDGALQFLGTPLDSMDEFVDSLNRIQPSKYPLSSNRRAPSILRDLEKALQLDQANQSVSRAAVVLGGAQGMLSNRTPSTYPIRHFPLSSATKTDDAVLHNLAIWLNDLGKHGYYRVALCGVEPSYKVSIQVQQEQVLVPLPNMLLVEDKRRCNLEQITTGKRVFPEQIFFNFTERQRVIYDAAYAGLSKKYFELEIALTGDGPGHLARAHFRGQGSFRRCRRKSFTLDFPGETPWALLPRTNANKFYLLSMCRDSRFLRTHTMFQLWQSIGMFPYQFRLIELVLDQESQGVYMLLEKPAEVIPREQPGVNAVIRRDFTPPHAVMDIKYARIDESIISGNYVNAFLDIDHLADAEQIDALEKVLDIDQFITHLASATILRNGDYIDELWFIEYQYLRKNGDIGYRYRIAKWDPEDTFRPCHHSGEFAYKDKWEIAFCVESDIGKAILSNRVLYRLFIDKIEQLLSTSLSLERFKAEINNTVNLLADKFRSDSTALAMERLQRHEGPLVGEAMVSVISAFADELINLYIERRAILTERISFYRASI